MTTLCAFALLLNDRSRLLLCRRKKDGLWNLPGGEAESREAPWQAVMREVREELGVGASVERLVGIYTVPHSDDLVLTFRCAALSDDFRASDEIDQIDGLSRADCRRTCASATKVAHAMCSSASPSSCGLNDACDLVARLPPYAEISIRA